MEEITITIDNKEYSVTIEEGEGGDYFVHMGQDVFSVKGGQSAESAIYDNRVSAEDLASEQGIILAPLPGTIYDVKVAVGDAVKKGDSLIKLIAMKMENDILCPKDGKIKEIAVKKQDSVNKGDVLIKLE